MGIRAGFLHFTIPTPDCPKCGPTDYTDGILSVGYSKIEDPPHHNTRWQWSCVKCGDIMPGTAVRGIHDAQITA